MTSAPSAAKGGVDGQQPDDRPWPKVSDPFWDAARQRRLVLQHCAGCERAVWYPRVICPHCSSTELEWRDATGRGIVYAVSVQHGNARSGSGDGRLCVVLVDLEEGVRMMSNVVGCDADDVVVGRAIQAAWEPLADGRNLLVFELSEGTA